MGRISNWILYFNNWINERLKRDKKQLDNDTLRYYIDELDISLCRLVIKGWIADEKRGPVLLKLVFSNSIVEHDVQIDMIERTDVRDFLNIKEADVGFDIDLGISTSSDWNVFLEYKIDEIKNRIFIKTIKANKKIGKFIINDNKKQGTAFDSLSYSFSKINKVGCRFYVWSKIDIIVPVYNGFDYLEKLFDTISNTHMRYRLLVIDDKSSDERVLPFLRELASKDRRITLIENEENLGFVQSVNKALAMSENHVTIVNTDVVLPKNWLERLMYPIIRYSDVASATPFTNSGTICSFPNFCENNDIYMDLDVNDVDKEFARVKPQYTFLPTGVGFCMGMNKNAIAAIGLFDEKTFYKGYGEENDWCQRASQKGFRNVMVENLFVWHKHGGSFLPEDKQLYIERNLKLLSERYPNYDSDVANYCASDTVKYIRNCIQWKMIKKKFDKYIIAFDHDWGGGANKYLLARIEEWNNRGYGLFRIIYSRSKQLLLELYCGDDYCTFSFSGFDELDCVLRQVSFDVIYVNEIISYPDLRDIQNFILNLKVNYNAKLIMMVHDFLSICPSIYLMNSENVHCFKPDLEECRKCFQKNGNLFNDNYATIDEWRKDWEIFLIQCDEIRTFSENTKEYLLYWYPNIERVTVVPHKVDYIGKVNKKEYTGGKLTIGFIGNLMKTKGMDIISDMAGLIKERNIEAQIVVIGQNCENCEADILIHGPYEREELPSLIEKYSVDVIFIASIWPETFSYTTEEAIKMGVPVAAFDIGAPAERLKKYDKGIIIEKIDAENALETIVSVLKK